MPKFPRTFNSALGLMLLAGISYCTLNFASAQGRIQDLCRQTKLGMSLSELRLFASAHGLGPQPRMQSGVNYLVESQTFGRHGCQIVLEAGQVTSADYNFAD
jgi:hypothetical protein